MDNEFQILRLQKNHYNLFKELVELLNEVFEEPQSIGSKKQLEKLLNKEDFYAIVILRNNTILGGLTAYALEQYYSNKTELYIYDIAVKTELHNKGIGKKLINYLKEYSTKKGFVTVFVQAHSEDKQAVKFYNSTFGESEKVDFFTFKTKI